MRVLNLDPEDCLKSLATQQVNATPDSLLLLESPALGADGTEEGSGAGSLFLHIGRPREVLIKFHHESSILDQMLQSMGGCLIL